MQKKVIGNFAIIAAAVMLMSILGWAQTTAPAKTGAPKPGDKKPAGAQAKDNKAAPLIDLNSAPREKLMTLEGIGDTYVDKIIAGRPYKLKTDLTKRKIIPVATYQKIASKVIANQPKK